MLRSEDRNDEPDLDKQVRLAVAEWASAIGLQDTSPQFYEDVCNAIRSCIGAAANSKRTSEICKELQRVNEAAEVAAKSLWKLHYALKDLKPQSRKKLDDYDMTAEKLDLHLIPAPSGSLSLVTTACHRAGSLWMPASRCG